MTYQHEGQLITNAGTGNANFVTVEVVKLEKAPKRLVIQTRSRSAHVDPDPASKPINDQTSVSETTLTLEGDAMRVRMKDVATTRQGPSPVIDFYCRRVGGPTGKPSTLAGPVSNDYLPLKVGNVWRYRHNGSEVVATIAAEETVGGVRAARLEMRANGQPVSHEHLLRRADGYYRAATNGVAFGETIKILGLPPRNGDHWGLSVKVGESKADGEVNVTEEDVTVPAGRYKTYHVSMVIKDGQNTVIAENWYAKGVGSVKQRVQSGGTELLFELERFEPAR
jgi:hypothetical protein